ncbi:MAG: hypothetical protein H6Q13_2463 [Bacteroidetes bacterium]|nr:hypothetical protein [Bacteroidota bacterium]
MYDGRNRCKAKRLPGCSWNYYVYDTGDRLIFSQDGEQRKKEEWGFTLPDVFGRTCTTGICKNSFSALAATPPLNNVVVKVTRDNTMGTYKGYTLSGITLVSPTVLNVNYYDDYAFMGKNGIPDSTDTYFRYEPISGFGIRYKESAKTFLTGTLTAKLDGSSTPTYLYSVMYYDYRGRVIQTKSNNHLTGGIEKEYVAYNFTGQPTQKKHIHSATGKTTQTEIYSYDYDHAGRLLTVKHKLNSGTNMGRLVTLVKNTYDELGRLKTNMKDSLAALTTTYAYNVRSWMKSSSSPLFSQTLYYNDSYGNNTLRYNGNISAMSWTTSGDKTRGYNFAYDNLSRLTAAGYLEGGVANTSYGTSYAYDKHGNMTNLIRNGRTGTSTFGTIDNLSMNYAGNQLIKADDAGTSVTLSASMDFKNNSTAAKEYFYDLNGNLTQDLNKGITGITYNLLNLPQSVAISNTLGQSTNTYTYAADGLKLRSIIGSKQTDYVGNVIYEGGVLKRILVDGGYIEGGTYYFYLTDHLGNNRVVANANGGIVQTNHYYPFGMSFAEGVTTSQQPYKYNAKELDTERGLNLYDYSARLMDPVLGRFSTVDPFAEKYYSVSPYIYVGNNPMNAIDLRGDTITTVITSTVDGVTTNRTYYYGQDAKGNYGFLDSSGQMYSGDDQFVVSLTTALGNLQKGTTGKALAGDLINSTNTVQIVQARGLQKNGADPKGGYIRWDPNSTTGGPDQEGGTTRPTYIGLGHEMAHINDVWNGTYNASTWTTVEGIAIPNAEKYATHIENQLRSEHGLPLRTHYSPEYNSTEILQFKTNKSLFYKRVVGINGIFVLTTPYMY